MAKPIPSLMLLRREARRVCGPRILVFTSKVARGWWRACVMPKVPPIGAFYRWVCVDEPTYAECRRSLYACLKALPTLAKEPTI